MEDARLRAIIRRMLMTGSSQIDAQRAFTRETRARRRTALAARAKRWGRRPGAAAPGGRLAVVCERELGRATALPGRGVREIALDEIRGTLEPSRAAMFDAEFRPTAAARSRWQRVWLAEHRGQPLPPISVVPVQDGYAVQDGHHRISVARARGALTIDASVETTPR